MRTITITEDKANKRIDKVLRETFPRLPNGALFKAFRKKDIKVNGVRVKEDHIVKLNDRVDIYIIDEILDGVPKAGELNYETAFSVAYEDSNLLIVNKKQGIPVHPDRTQTENTLIDFVKEYLKLKGEFEENSGFTPSLCHRLDRNTGGLVMIAKNSSTLHMVLKKMKSGEISKYYQCLVKGKMEKKEDILKAYLEKDEKKSRVFIKDTKSKNAVEIITDIKCFLTRNFRISVKVSATLRLRFTPAAPIKSGPPCPYRTSCCGRRQIRNQHLQPSFRCQISGFMGVQAKVRF